ncbi:histidinol dehydrogenase [Micrococcus luteus]|jgi:histidinol dehydrogenase|uniref:Histidinol dehydrogenase n=1 Tax=Micrococcus luteus (strain ATCC 4698 / DSM 20030 / JCM 1464 / CCM 169 / CCUG 5858 / IAM 1056 / NBRC 3333 / NCIMB 9278 / NCTC 2665 / VKM Ac-2230) TaxID=465515 RepID=C5C6S4_MICLC|nr:histidinol dehydrogenase [Micrococcus luteus]ACS31412.1 histidinol dehydrogenase [Micrococcus luteus NCTC 2665]AJO56470.1 histidinol dehydrogenase [Micrococcus luteus]KAB1902040.1 histidinol dehydrogenase [Micrococcus luteus NCTC 2665]MCV7527690.1 histidinol dehydrogenase [Micrococcus luteus]ORE59249.1 histidinol dehydrogenase [Micrococcus luteus]
MLSVTDLRPLDTATADLSRIIPRANVDVSSVVPVVAPIIEQVRHGGEQTLLELAERFDGVRPPALRVPAEALEAALAGLDPRVRAALEESIRRARLVHDAQHPQDSTVELGEGAVVENHWTPVGRVGLYVPGGRAVYPSSVVMNVVPAQAAGVGSLAVTSPPQRDHGGLPHPTVLAACALLGVDEVYAAGGAQAVAMLAHGVQDDDGGWLCAPVDLVTGPGNVYVAAAKRALQGVIGVDAEAGPSEIAVIADGTARADWVAADLISQSEHDPLAASVLITDSEDLLRDVLAAIEAQVPGAFHEDQIREALTGPQSGVLLVRDMDQAVEVSDRYATEHLEIQTRDPEALVGRIRNAGAVFVGPHAPVPLGDYSAGSNHVLPTSGTARHSSGLNTVTFLRLQQRICYTETGLEEVADGIGVLAEDERLPAHAAAIRARFA